MQENLLSYLIDTSHLLPCITSVSLIVFGCFRSLSLDSTGESKESLSNIQVIDGRQAAYLPLGSSISLLCMFFFFDSLQIFVVITTAGISVMALHFVLQPLWNSGIKLFVRSNELAITRPARGCHLSPLEITSIIFSILIVLLWLITGHWLIVDIIGMALCTAVITYVRLPNLYVSTFLLCGLLLYDVFWVYFSEGIFKSNVMVHVAMNDAKNPLILAADKVNVPTSANSILRSIPKSVQLPGKLIFPSLRNSDYYAVLGLGDIVIPGLLASFTLRFDDFRHQQDFTDMMYKSNRSTGFYFRCFIIGYVFGLLLATLVAAKYKAPQPALLFLVPSTLIPVLVSAYVKGDLMQMWSHPFYTTRMRWKTDSDTV